jgi:TRAP-type C4-dicarboxylate transport system substrate-binding protein
MKTPIAALLLSMGLISTAVAQEEAVKLGTLAPDGSPWHTILRDLMEDWKKATDGKLKAKIFAGGTIGDEPDMVRKMRIGQINAAALTGVGLAEIAPEIMAIQLPRLLTNYEELDAVLEKMKPEFEALLLKKDFVVLNWGDAGWVHFFAKMPLVKFEDLKGAKLMVWSASDGEMQGWKDTGASPVALPVPEALTGLNSGLINSFATTPLAALSMQWFGLAKNMSDMNWAPLIGATVITKKRWEKFDDAAKGKLLVAAKASGERFKRETRKFNEDAIDQMKKNGLVVHVVDEAGLKEWDKQARIAWPKLMGNTIPKEIVTRLEAAREEFRAAKNPGK